MTRCKREVHIPYLSLDIVFNILVHLPADILYNVMRSVCRDWFNIVSSPGFIHAHLKNAESGLLIYQCKSLHYVEGMMTKNEALLRMVEVGRNSEPGYVNSPSCNGLVLMSRFNILYITNIVTKEFMILPHHGENGYTPRMVYTPFSKKYKLVLFCGSGPGTECRILTLGVDREWRSLFQVPIGTKLDKFGIYDFIHHNHISAEGILHVIHRNLPLVFNLDLETETYYTRETPKPKKKNRTTYVGNGRSLCFLDYLGKFSWELWLLSDAEKGDWTKMATIDLGPQKQMLRHTLCPTEFELVPVGFLNDGKILVFNVVHENGIHEWKLHHCTHPSRNCITYNFTTGGMDSFHLGKGETMQMDEPWMYVPHVKSLVSPRLIERQRLRVRMRSVAYAL